MKNIIIGTAGHIDHGKTTLIKALTGRDMDCLEEEKRRGITIDLGFTYVDLSNGDRIGIIDVPGHEKFIHNMVAGVAGMDMVLLVVAADEGIMPQTREHMDILGQLGVEKSIVVLNKCDLVDKEWLELVEEDLREELAGTFLENAAIVKTSAVTGEGIAALLHLIEQVTTEEVKQKNTETIPRLPIDRVFSISGFGTVVTGTLLSGTITKDTTLMLYPLQKECKIRSIQVHGEEKEQCFAGQRVAINLSNIKKSEIDRGFVLAPSSSMKNTMLLDVKLEILSSSSRTLINRSRLHLYTGTSEVLCRCILLDKEELKPGANGYVQLRLEESVAVRRGDRFIVRFYSPLETIGGGVVLEPNPVKKKRFQKEMIEELRKKEQGSLQDILEMHIQSHNETMITQTELAKLTACSLEEVLKDLEALQEQGIIRVFPMKKELYAWHIGSALQIQQKILDALRLYQCQFPYRYGMKKAEIHTTFMKKIKPYVFDKYIDQLVEEGIIAKYKEFIHEGEFLIEKNETYKLATNYLTGIFTDAKYNFVRYSEIEPPVIQKSILDRGVMEDILAILIDEEIVVKIEEDLYTTSELMNRAKEVIQKALLETPVVTIAQVRDLFETSRKSAKPILEYMDSIKVTKKNGTESERVAYR